MKSKFENNKGLKYGNDIASSPFRLLLANSSLDLFDPKLAMSSIDLIKIQPGKQFNLEFRLFSIDKFNQNALSMINNEFFNIFFYF